MHVLEMILGVPVVIAIGIWWTFGGGRPSPRYWQCTAHHNHRTPEAARRCSAAQRRG